MPYEELKNSGVTEKTPDNILLGAGTIHKGLKYDTAKKWNFAESLVGATSGGNKFTIKPEISSIDVDGVLVRMQELDVKQGETATLEINFAEITEDILKASVIGKVAESDVEGYTLLTSKPDITVDDYFENISFVGRTITGKPIIVILGNALCTSGLELEGKNKEAGVGKYTFECSQKLTGDSRVLPYKIYYPAANKESGGK